MKAELHDLLRDIRRYWHNRILRHFQADITWSTAPGVLQTTCDCGKVWRWENE